MEGRQRGLDSRTSYEASLICANASRVVKRSGFGSFLGKILSLIPLNPSFSSLTYLGLGFSLVKMGV
jgi:hypothetical protein